jgi:hypothetical protein
MHGSHVVRLALALVAPLACRTTLLRTAAPESMAQANESRTGIVRIVGLDALPVVTLALDDGTPSLTLDGPASLRRVDGLRIEVTGGRVGPKFIVRRFAVIAANGLAATDGMLAMDGDALLLVTPDGVRHRLVNPPALLRENAGHRAWVSGPIDREAVAFGIIE